MSQFQSAKNAMKKILPPPTTTFMREINEVKRETNEVKQEINGVKQEISGVKQETNGVKQNTNELKRKNDELKREVYELKHQVERLAKEIRSASWDNYSPGHWMENYVHLSSIPEERYPEELCKWYYQKTGEVLNLVNPKTFNEKIQWMKLYDATPLKTRLADKYLVRDWVKEKIGEEYLIPLLGVWDSFDEIDFDKLPNRFVLKANHGCGWNIIVKDKSQFDYEDARNKFNRWMRTNFAFISLELQYMNIPPKIIAEEYLENGDSDLYDYKVFCFNGHAESIMFLSERKKGLKMAFYDLEWNKLPFVYSFEQNEEMTPKPKDLKLLIDLAEKLAAGFPHVRVDFYITNSGSIKFGEMTFTSASGQCKWNIPEQDRVYGDMIPLPPKSPIPERLM